MKKSSFFLLLLSAQTFAGDMVKESLTDLSMVMRDPVFTSSKRKEYLDFTRKKMVQELSKDLKTPEGELNLTFMRNPTKANILMGEKWLDLQTEFYTTIHQENFQERWTSLQRLVKFTDYGKSIYATMMGHLGNYSPVNEGRFYLRWHTISLHSEEKTRNFKTPYFLMSKSIDELINLEAHVPYEDLFKEKELQTLVSNTQGFTRLKRQELAEKMELNRRIYQRAVANSAKTIGSIYYLTGANSRHEAEGKVSGFVDRYCEGCSIKEKSESTKGALNYIDRMKKTISYENPVNVVRNICSSLHKNGYQWNIDRLKPTPIDLYMDMTKLVDYYTLHKLKKKNVEAMAKTMAEQDLGILFITNAVTLLDKSKEPIGTKLGCTKNSEILDVSYMAKAIEEAEYNITQYIIRVGSKFKEAKYDVKLTNSLVEYFVQTNHTASIEATSSYPQGIGWILKSLAELDQNARSREKVDNIVTWGGAILGIGLTLTGVGAPEGVSIMIAAVGVVKGIAAGTYFVIRASEEREFAKEIQLSKNGGGGVSDANLKKHYSDYKQLKILYIKEFGQSALNFVNLHRMCMNRTGDVGKAHSILRRVFETAKDTGKETAIETLQDLVLNAAVAG